MLKTVNPDPKSKDHDLVLLGATGVTGRRAYSYLIENVPAGFRWAIAGRNREKLEALLASSPATQERPDLLIVDLSDPTSIEKMIKRTRVLIHLAGPYADHGAFIYELCIRHQTDYIDIGGETFFLKEMIRRFHQQADDRGVKLIPVAGYESTPFDLLTLAAVEKIQKEYSETCIEAKIVVSFIRTGPVVDNRISGGSLGTMRNILASDDTNTYNDPTCLLPPFISSNRLRKRNKISYRAKFDADIGRMTAPLFPAPFLNVPVVLRSAHLLRQSGYAYDEDFRYKDSMTVEFFATGVEGEKRYAKKVARQYQVTSWAVAGPRPLRLQLKRRLDNMGVSPGDGPSDDALSCVDYKLELFAQTNSGRSVRASLYGDGHPGYLSTARLAVEAWLALALERDTLPGSAGILTPASGLGLEFLPRAKKAGLRIAFH